MHCFAQITFSAVKMSNIKLLRMRADKECNKLYWKVGHKKQKSERPGGYGRHYIPTHRMLLHFSSSVWILTLPSLYQYVITKLDFILRQWAVFLIITIGIGSIDLFVSRISDRPLQHSIHASDIPLSNISDDPSLHS